MVLLSPNFRVMREAEANKLKLTPQFLELKFIEAIADNTKIFFGDKVNLSLSLMYDIVICIGSSLYKLYSVVLPCRFPIWFWIRGCWGTS